MSVKDNWKKYAEAVVKAIASYIDLPMEETNYYIVKQGDTLWSIAKNNNITINDLKKYNNLNSNLLSVGQKLYFTSRETNVTGDNSTNKYVVLSATASLTETIKIMIQ